MGTKMGPSYANLFAGYVEHQFLISTTVPNLISTVATLTTASAQFHPAERNSIVLFYYFRQFFSPSSKIYLGNFRNFAGFSRYQSLYQWQRFMY